MHGEFTWFPPMPARLQRFRAALPAERCGRPRDGAPLIPAGEMLCVCDGRVRRRCPRCLALQHDRRHADGRLWGKLPLDFSERGIAGRIAVTDAIRMDDDLDEIRIAE